jgi:hypothetical protein
MLLQVPKVAQSLLLLQLPEARSVSPAVRSLLL